MSTIALQDLSKEQRAQLVAEVQEQEKQEKEAQRQKVEDYKELVSETVLESVAELQKVSEGLSAHTKRIYDNFAVLFDLKQELFPKTAKNNSHTFSSRDGKSRIKLGYRMLDNYDDTVNEGVAIVKDYIGSLVNDGNTNTQQLVDAVLKLLAKDSNGNLKPSRVMQLRKIAIDSGNKEFINGVEIIENAYKPERSKQFIKVEIKGEHNQWVNVPLGMTEA